jgi:phosphoglycolate phosphatase
MIDAVIFDKDGTLFDFRASWGGWTKRLLEELAGGDAQVLTALAGAARFDLATLDFAADSPIIANPMPEIAEALGQHLPGQSLDEIMERMNAVSMVAPQTPAVDLPAVLGALKARGLVLGLATNDTEAPARQHLADAGVLELFDFVAGCDSGWGGKPAPGQLLAFVAQGGFSPDRVAMVGDSLHDLDAGRAAGMHAVAVLTGIATADDLAPHADVVLRDIGGLAAWIDGLNRV